MLRRPPISTRTDTLFPYTTLFRSPGDALVWLGGTLHGAGANVSDAPRRGIIVSYCLGWLKPFELQWLVYPPEVARHFDPDLAALVGYAQHRPNLGNVVGRFPSFLLASARSGERRVGKGGVSTCISRWGPDNKK